MLFQTYDFQTTSLKILKHRICFAQQLKVIANLVGQTERHICIYFVHMYIFSFLLV